MLFYTDIRKVDEKSSRLMLDCYDIRNFLPTDRCLTPSVDEIRNIWPIVDDIRNFNFCTMFTLRGLTFQKQFCDSSNFFDFVNRCCSCSDDAYSKAKRLIRKARC